MIKILGGNLAPLSEMEYVSIFVWNEEWTQVYFTTFVNFVWRECADNKSDLPKIKYIHMKGICLRIKSCRKETF